MSDAVRIGLIGATGLIGAGVMAQCVGREDVRLTGIARRETQLPRGIRMELFVADPANWGDVIEAVRPTAINPGVPTPSCTAAPIAVDASAMIEATDRSISPEMISRAMAKAIMAFSVKLKVASDRFQAFRK